MTEGDATQKVVQDRQEAREAERKRDQELGVERVVGSHGRGVYTQEDLDEEARQRGDENAPPRPENSSGVTAEEIRDAETPNKRDNVTEGKREDATPDVAKG